MREYLLSVVGCLCLLPGLSAEECSQAVLARRETFYVPEGGSLSLSCVVQHCGDTWTGNWRWQNATDERFSTIRNSERHHLTNVTLSANGTRLVLNLQRVNQLDEGSYGCKVTWGEGYTDQGHLMYVNITAAVPSQRNLLHRVLVCVGAFLCLPVILGLARCVRSEVKPHPHPRTQSTHVAVHRDEPDLAPLPLPRCPVQQKHRASSHKASPKSQQNTEVLYADVSMEAPRPKRVVREPPQSTVYSSLKFS
ncbi:Cell adhesion molecule 3 [Solea senegalensis]|uniref:Cell adhesion molecule 3 n=1 Tax=Solea senegalensis TaxID=28829 RepID=A0AAV6Q1R4_SOLSE|nr:uncharacterized protein si:dkey-52l18.4 [Solea senegalensis]KAG7479864.1 Cell adhesion molecule 3 [Solea senegalensis]